MISRTCYQCGRDFDAARASALTCSNACRQARHRDSLRQRGFDLLMRQSRAVRANDQTALAEIEREAIALFGPA